MANGVVLRVFALFMVLFLPEIVAQTNWYVEPNVASARMGADVVACDLNGDSFIDFATSGVWDVYVYLGGVGGVAGAFNSTPNYIFKISNTTIITDGIALECADLNEDGISDLIVGNWSTTSNLNHVFVYNGAVGGLNATPSTTIVYTLGSQPYFGCDLAVADYNHDGHKDLAVGAYGTGRVVLYYGQGVSGISTTPSFPSALSVAQLTFAQNIYACDLSNDNFPDLLVGVRAANSQQGMLYIMSNQGGTWSRAFQWNGTASNGNYGQDAKCGDFNNDGFKDLAILAVGERVLYIHLGTGDLQDFSRISSFNISLIDSCRFISIIDINGDGYDDIVGGYNGIGAIRVFYGGPTFGQGSSASFSFSSLSGTGWRVAATTNVDGIGYRDIAWGAYSYSSGSGAAGILFGIPNSPSPSASSSPSSSVTPSSSSSPSSPPTPSVTRSVSPTPSASQTPSTSATPTATPSTSSSTSPIPSSSVSPSSRPSSSPCTCFSASPIPCDDNSSSDTPSNINALLLAIAFLIGLVAGLIIGMCILRSSRSRLQPQEVPMHPMGYVALAQPPFAMPVQYQQQ